jgi:hypothetical protein
MLGGLGEVFCMSFFPQEKRRRKDKKKRWEGFMIGSVLGYMTNSFTKI